MQFLGLLFDVHFAVSVEVFFNLAVLFFNSLLLKLFFSQSFCWLFFWIGLSEVLRLILVTLTFSISISGNVLASLRHALKHLDITVGPMLLHVDFLVIGRSAVLMRRLHRTRSLSLLRILLLSNDNCLIVAISTHFFFHSVDILEDSMSIDEARLGQQR